METKDDILDFAERWASRFAAAKGSPEAAVDFDALGEECERLGFSPDGESLNRQFPGAFDSASAFSKVSEEISDVGLLGNAIYAQWRYATSWGGPFTAAEIADLDLWFSLAFQRLVSLAA